MLAMNIGFHKMRMIFVALFFLLLLFPLGNPANALDLRGLIRHVEEQYRGQSSHTFMSMQVKTSHWDRSMVMEGWSLGRDHFLVRILEPSKERGVSTLKVHQEVWNYLPKVDRVIKIPPSMMGGSWMGSHITNDDLVKASYVDEDYTFTLLEETNSLYRIECLPKPEAAVVWGKIVYEIQRPQLVPSKVAYFDEAMLMVREFIFEDVRTIDKRTIPLRVTVQPLEKPEEKTVLQYQEIKFDIPIEKDFFSLRELKSR
jgi:hypothetical protein